MSNELSIEKYILLVRMRARLIVAIFVSTIALAGIVTYLTPKMYTATSTVNFDFNSANPLDSNGRALAEDTYIFTQVDIIKSQSVSQRVEDSLSEYEWGRVVEAFQAKNSVIDNIRLGIMGAIASIGSSDENISGDSDGSAPNVSAEPKSPVDTLDIKSAYSWLARTISYDLSVEPRFNSRIVDISFSSPDPQVAAIMANRFSEAYIAANLDMTINPARKTTAWFDEQLKSLRKKLEGAQAALTAYQQEHGIVSSDERLDTETSRLQELSSQLIAAQASTRDAVTMQNKLQEILDSGADLVTFQPIFGNSVVQSIKKEIRNLESKLVELSGSLGKNHPRRKQVASELSAARKRLAVEIRSITDGINNAAGLSVTREKGVATALETQKQIVLGLKQEHDKISVLKRDVESAQATYNAALTQLNTTSMQSMLDQTNVTVIDPANVPSRPSSPKLMKNLVLGAIAGLLLGIGLVVFMELFVRRVHSKEDLTVELGIPLLGHLKNV